MGEFNNPNTGGVTAHGRSWRRPLRPGTAAQARTARAIHRHWESPETAPRKKETRAAGMSHRPGDQIRYSLAVVDLAALPRTQL